MTIIFLKIATHLMIYLLQHPTFCPPKPLMFFLKKNLFKSTKVEPFLTISGNYSFSYTKDKEGDCSTFPWKPNCKCLWLKSWVLSIGCLSKWQLFHHCFVVILSMLISVIYLIFLWHTYNQIILVYYGGSVGFYQGVRNLKFMLFPN